MPKYPANKSCSFTQNIETYTSKPHVIPYKLGACVRVDRACEISNARSK